MQMKTAPNIITFKYVVMQAHWSFDLSLQDPRNVEIIVEPEEFIRRDSTLAVTDVNRTIPWSSMSNLPEIEIQGKRPEIEQIKYSAGQDGKIFVHGDEISIDVQFSSTVVVRDGPPVLILNAGSELYYEAIYNGGNQTTALVFKYSIQPGDRTSSILCSRVCVSSGCLEGVSNEGYILQMSANPTSDASLQLPGRDYRKLQVRTTICFTCT